MCESCKILDGGSIDDFKKIYFLVKALVLDCDGVRKILYYLCEYIKNRSE